MLAFLHKANLPNAHDDMLFLFPPRPRMSIDPHDKQLWNIMGLSRDCTFYPEMATRTIFHLVHVYNKLPQHIVDQVEISDLQSALTDAARRKLTLGHQDWATFLSPRTFSGSLNFP